MGQAAGYQAVNGMFLTWPNDDDLVGGVINLAVDEAGSLWSLTRYVGLRQGQARQVAADVPRPECLADYPTMGAVVGELHTRALGNDPKK